MLKEKNGSRNFEKITRWNTIEYTFITRKSIYAPYTDNLDSDDAKLCLTYFNLNKTRHPLKRFKDLESPIILEDNSKLIMEDDTTGWYLEMSPDKNKIRLYKEVE